MVTTFEDMQRSLTVVKVPPERCWATDLAMDGFSATHSIFLGAMVVDDGVCPEQP